MVQTTQRKTLLFMLYIFSNAGCPFHSWAVSYHIIPITISRCWVKWDFVEMCPILMNDEQHFYLVFNGSGQPVLANIFSMGCDNKNREVK